MNKNIYPPNEGFTSSTGLMGWYGDQPPTKDDEIREKDLQTKANAAMKNFTEQREKQQEEIKKKEEELKGMIENLREGL